jgi:hypothetical protein
MPQTIRMRAGDLGLQISHNVLRLQSDIPHTGESYYRTEVFPLCTEEKSKVCVCLYVYLTLLRYF